jgi:hypothetical protein
MTTIRRRSRARATLRALQKARKIKAPSFKQIQGIAANEGVHWTTIYRALRESA